ncbi:MAG: TlpA disulfide reductase family protein [Acidobacteria bacterium]|nr:TlpA disulfide reductase family protein [Acidobacteriota bacterium]
MLLLAALVARAGVGQAEANPPAGILAVDAMDFSATALDGESFAGSELAGKTVLLDFWAVWCAPCITAFPRLNRLQAEFGDRGFTVLGVTAYSGSPTDVRTFLLDHQVDYPIIMADEELVQSFGVIGYPTYFLVRPDGSVYQQYVGEMPDLYEAVASDLELLERARASETTRADKEVS